MIYFHLLYSKGKYMDVYRAEVTFFFYNSTFFIVQQSKLYTSSQYSMLRSPFLIPEGEMAFFFFSIIVLFCIIGLPCYLCLKKQQ